MQKLSTLTYLRISTGTLCNKKCWYCFRESINRETPNMHDIDSVAWLVSILKSEFNLKAVRFTGGEPLLNPCIDDLISVVKKAGINQIGLTTNGLLLKGRIANMAKRGLDSLAIHLDEKPKKNQNNGLKQAIEFETFFEAQKTILNMRVNVVVTKSTRNKVVEILSFCNQFGVNVLLLDLLPNGNGAPHLFLKEYDNMSKFREVITKFGGFEYDMASPNVELYKRSDMVIKIVKRFEERNKNIVFCTKNLLWHPILLTSDFNLIWCNHFGSEEIKIQNDIINRDKYAVIDKFIDAIDRLKKCNCCKAITLPVFQISG